MALNTSYKKKAELYKEHLITIKGLKFTFREIDILACIVHNRGEKKIASLLSISPRTVSVHVYNAMNKLACNTKDQIIDFLEASGKLLYLREYYLHLLIKSSFEKQLTHISNRINQNGATFYCYRDDVLALDSDLYQSIQKHLSMARIKLVETAQGENNSPIFELSNISEAGYYRDLLKNLLEVINPPQKEQMIREFDDAYQTIEHIHNGKAAVIDEKDNQDLNGNHKNKIFFGINKILNNRNLKIFASLLVLLIVLFVGSLMNFTNILITNDANFAKNTSIGKVPTAAKDLEEFLRAVKDQEFTADNSHPDKIKKNQNSIKKIEKILEYNKLKDVQEYLTRAEMPAEILMQYLYHLQALASYYMYNMHDGEKSQQILLHAKNLAEKYVNIRGSINNDFNELKKEEILAELNILKDLPQMYTRIIYSLARTYIYKKNVFEGKKYFDLAEYLGNKLGLFEGYMSQINGLLVLEGKLADSYIKEDNIGQAIKILHHIVQSCLTLSDDSQSYIADYNPGVTEQKTIIPKENLYNLSICATIIIPAYSKLIQIKNDAKEIQHYIDDISKYLQIYEKKGGGFQKILNQVPGEKLANLYNKLGNLILILWQCTNIKALDIDTIRLKQEIITAFLKGDTYEGNLNLIHDDLVLAEKLFTVAKEKSRSTEYTKADSYEGLIITYKHMLNHTHGLLENQRYDLKIKINNLLNKLKLIKNNKI